MPTGYAFQTHLSRATSDFYASHKSEVAQACLSDSHYDCFGINLLAQIEAVHEHCFYSSPAWPRIAVGRAEVLGSIPDLVAYFKRGSCQLPAKVCARSTR